MDKEIQEIIDVVVTALVSYGLNVVGAFAIIIFGLIAAGWTRKSAEGAPSRSRRADPTLTKFFGSLVKGDFVDIVGKSGTVKEVGLFTTEMATGDNVKIIMPNGQIWGQAISNFSANPTRRVDLMMGIDYGDNIDTAVATINRVIGEKPRALTDPEATVAVAELADSSVYIVVRIWVNAGDYWGVRCDITRKLKEQLEADGISIPFPQRVVHHVNQAAE